jgi:hypothetical protein
MSMTLNALIHTSGVAIFGYSLYYNNFHVHFPRTIVRAEYLTAFPGKWKFLTVWNLALQLVYYSVSLINDAAGSSELEPKKQTFLQKLRDSLFASWAFPTGMFVSLSFWTLYGVDRSMVFPIEMDAFYPCWLNHAVHTGPILFLAMESYFVPRTYPNKAFGICGNLTFSSSYAAWIVYWYQQSGVWPYPILDTLNNTQRAIFIGSSGLAIFGFYFLGEALYNWRWGGKSETKIHAGKAKAAGKTKRKTK